VNSCVTPEAAMISTIPAQAARAHGGRPCHDARHAVQPARNVSASAKLVGGFSRRTTLAMPTAAICTRIQPVAVSRCAGERSVAIVPSCAPVHPRRIQKDSAGLQANRRMIRPEKDTDSPSDSSSRSRATGGKPAAQYTYSWQFRSPIRRRYAAATRLAMNHS